MLPEAVRSAIFWAADAIFGPWTIALLFGTGIFLSVRLRFVQVRRFADGVRTLIPAAQEGARGPLSPFQAFMTALGASIGTGNIAGVAAAIAVGGPGALFWMWITGLVGMATKFAEAVLAVKYRVVDPKGQMAGGPMYYLSRGLGGSFGKTLGWLFALFAAIAAFGIGNMVQSNSVADALQSSFGVSPLWTGIVIAVLAGAVILGGIQAIGRFTSFFVPLMIGFYIVGGLVVLAINWRGLDDVFVFVLKDAFRPSAAVGGFAGATFMAAVRMGVARGVFSNESGLGTGGIAAAAAQTNHPVTQALVSMTQTFIDTIVVCSITGFTIIATGAWTLVDPATGRGYTGAPLTTQAFSTGLPGQWGGAIVAIGLALFAFSTILGWSYYGEKAIEYLLGIKAIFPYRIAFVIASFLGAWVLTLQARTGFELVWGFADVMNGMMAFPNLVGLLLLSGVVARETREYLETRKATGNG